MKTAPYYDSWNAYRFVVILFIISANVHGLYIWQYHKHGPLDQCIRSFAFLNIPIKKKIVKTLKRVL